MSEKILSMIFVSSAAHLFQTYETLGKFTAGE